MTEKPPLTETNPDKKSQDQSHHLPTGTPSSPPSSTDANPAPPPDTQEFATEANGSSDYISNRTFKDFPISAELVRGIEKHGYKVATPVQVAAIEPGLAGRDLVVRAKTGTGKTAAFGIPILDRIQQGARFPQAIVLTPTRELTVQVAQECASLGRFLDIRICTLYGGVRIGPQTDALKNGVDMIVGTPGRIIDHIRRGNLDLSRCHMACLDEADEMLSMGFFEDVTTILKRLAPKPQVFLFSATVSEKISNLIRHFLHDPVSMILSTDTDKVEGISHILYETDPSTHKVRSLLAIIGREQPGSTLIFCNTREDTSTVASFLDRQGLDVEIISGELPQKKREEVMAQVKRGEVQFLVATDVAARGIDISDLSHVINYSLPEDPAVYLHRTGRTGRIGKTGIAISLAGGTDLNTRSTLEKDYQVVFETRQLPTPEEVTQLILKHQTARLRDAMKTMAFEGYLKTVRALRGAPDGDMLLAVALRAFFLWDRQRKADAGTSSSSLTALDEKKRTDNQKRSQSRRHKKPYRRRRHKP